MYNSMAELTKLSLTELSSDELRNGNGIGQESRTQAEVTAELTDYLGNLGLGDEHLAKIASMIHATGQHAANPDVTGTHATGDETISVQSIENAAPEFQSKSALANTPAEEFRNPIPSTPSAPTIPSVPSLPQTNAVTLFMAEEQEILLQAFGAFFAEQPTVSLLGSSTDTSSEALIQAAQDLCPKVMLLGVKALRPSAVEMLESLRDACPKMPMSCCSLITTPTASRRFGSIPGMFPWAGLIC